MSFSDRANALAIELKKLCESQKATNLEVFVAFMLYLKPYADNSPEIIKLYIRSPVDQLFNFAMKLAEEQIRKESQENN